MSAPETPNDGSEQKSDEEPLPIDDSETSAHSLSDPKTDKLTNNDEQGAEAQNHSEVSLIEDAESPSQSSQESSHDQVGGSHEQVEESPDQDPKSHDEHQDTVDPDQDSKSRTEDSNKSTELSDTENHPLKMSPLVQRKEAGSESSSDSQSVNSALKLEDVALREKTPPSEDKIYKPKVHPLSVDTSDSELETSPPYSPGLYTSGDEGAGNVQGQSLHPLRLSVTPSPTLLDEHAPMSILFGGVTYLGCSSVDAPISEVEANRKMYTLKTQAASSKPMPVILSIPVSNDGNVILKDPDSEQPLSIFAVKMILFCARGNAEELLDCFCLNVKHNRSGIYRCHAFRCEIPEACQKIFQAIGKAFKTKPMDRDLPLLTEDELVFDFDVKIDIGEDDNKGGFSPVHFDKGCFKLRQNLRKKITLTVSQNTDHRPIIVERCFGLLISPSQVVKGSEMNLLDNMNCKAADNHTFSVMGIWEASSDPFLASLNQESKALGYKYLTIAADLVLECVTEPIRFKREVKVSGKSGLASIIPRLQKKTIETESSKHFRLKLKKCEEGTSSRSAMYTVTDLSMKEESEQTSRSSPGPGSEVEESVESSSHHNSFFKFLRSNKENKGEEESDGETQTVSDDVILSGWGDVDDTREDLLKDWGQLLEEWDGRDRSRPSKLVKLCGKGIPRHLRCQVWQMLTGASYDPQLQESYRLLISKESPAENVINWDIKRTYVGHGYFQETGGREALYKICKAYSVYDEEVGYCQGFSFMAATLLLQKMPEEQAFSVMVKILYNYKHRELFNDNFKYLHLMFFQLDRLLEEQLHNLFEHFKENRIETHMFASQWFLTLYTAKFPLSLVFRILDIYLCEGIKVVFQVAMALLKIASKDLLSLDFEGILNYFRVALPKKFQSEEEAKHLFHHMHTFKVSERKLAKFEKEYQVYLEQQAQLEDPVMRLERENKQLSESIMRLEGENDNLAQELVASKIHLRTEMDRLEERIDTLSKEARASKTSAELAQQLISELREELQQAKEEYQRVMVQLMEEKMQHDAAIAEYKQIFQQLDEGHQKEKGELNQELLEVKAKLGKADTEEVSEAGQHRSSLSSEERLRKLELELAQTKLALVESQCKNQELERNVQQLTSGSKGYFSNFSGLRKKK